MKELKTIQINKIVPNPYQPRQYFNEEGIAELANSIKENGLIQPISVRKRKGMYELIVGERRYRALLSLGCEEVEVYVLDENESGSMNKALIENIQRENLSAVEEAKAYVKIMQYQRITQSELAKQMGKSQPSVANKIRLLGLNEKIQHAVEAKSISERHARAMLSLDEKQQEKMLQSILQEGLSVEQTEKKIKEIKGSKKNKPQTKGLTRNVQIAINTIKQAVMMVEKTGVNAQVDMEEEEEFITIKVKIRK